MNSGGSWSWYGGSQTRYGAKINRAMAMVEHVKTEMPF